jgi:aerobic carbon-monoxide dehydrogenase small subunit
LWRRILGEGAFRGLERVNADPMGTEIRFWLAGNLCRCTGYDKIAHAVQAAVAEMCRAA